MWMKVKGYVRRQLQSSDSYIYSQLIQLILSRFWVQLYCESLSRLQARSYVSRHQISDPIRSRKLLFHQKTGTRKPWDFFFGTVTKDIQTI